MASYLLSYQIPLAKTSKLCYNKFSTSILCTFHKITEDIKMGKIFNIVKLGEHYKKFKLVKLIALIALLVGILCAGGGIAVAVLAHRGVGTGLILAGLGLTALSVAVTLLVNSKIKKQIGEALIEASVKKVLEGVTYKPDNCISHETVKNADMDFDFEYDRVHGGNYFTGSYNGVKVEMSEISLVTVKTDSDGEGGTAEKEKGVFKGVWCVLDLGKPLDCEMMLRERTGKLSKLAAKVFGSSKSITTDNKEFNGQFIITSDDEEAAVAILTGELMAYILELDRSAAGECYIRIRRNGRVHIAVDTSKPLFKLDRKTELGELSDRYTNTVKSYVGLSDRIKT